MGYLGSIMAIGDYKPTDQSIKFYNEISTEISAELMKLEKIKTKDLEELNKFISETNIKAIKTK